MATTEKEYFYPSTMYVTFCKVYDKTIEKLLDKLGIAGYRVGSVINRFAVEVPYGREEELAQALEDSNIVARIARPFVYGNRRQYRKKK